MSIYQHNDHYPGSNSNIEAKGIADVITGLAHSAPEDEETINPAFNIMSATIKALQEKIEAKEKKTHHTTAIIKVIAELTVGLGITTTPDFFCNNKKTGH